jgi:hypothetical protein
MRPEKAVVLKGEPIQYLPNFLKTRGSRREFVREDAEALHQLLGELAVKGNELDNKPLVWIEKMLKRENELRPSAAKLVGYIITDAIGYNRSAQFCAVKLPSFDRCIGLEFN